jgi:integrase
MGNKPVPFVYEFYVDDYEFRHPGAFETNRGKRKMQSSVDWLIEVKLKDLTEEHIAAWQKYLFYELKNKQTTVAKKTEMLLSFLNYCRSKGYYDREINKKNLMDLSRTENRYYDEHAFYNSQEFEEFLKFVPKWKYKVFYTTLISTGTRFQECCGFRFDDIKIIEMPNGSKKYEIEICRQQAYICGPEVPKAYYDQNYPLKNKRDRDPKSRRRATISEDLYKALMSLKKDDNQIQIFGEKMCTTAKQYHALVRKRYAKAKLENPNIKPYGILNLHGFRHSYSYINIVEKNMDYMTISKVLGHQDTTRLYNSYSHLKKTDDKGHPLDFGLSRN